MTVFATISFPAINPVFFQLGPIGIRWYGLAYLAGFALAYLGLRMLIRRGELRIEPSALGDLVSYAAAGVVVGGRAGWWLFYHWGTTTGSPWYEPFAIWHGGMSFHGGLIGVAVALLIWSRRRRASFWNIADNVALVAPVGLCFGRLANFINAELVGRATTVPWGVVFPGDTIARHPSQLYEAVLEGPLLFSALLLLRPWTRRQDGQLSAWLLILYGLFRFTVEFTRQPDAQLGFIAFGWLTMGQLLSLLLSVTGILLAILRLNSIPLLKSDDL